MEEPTVTATLAGKTLTLKQKGGSLTFNEISEINHVLLGGGATTQVAEALGMGRSKVLYALGKSGYFPAQTLVPFGRPGVVQALGEMWEVVMEAQHFECVEAVVSAAKEVLAEKKRGRDGA